MNTSTRYFGFVLLFISIFCYGITKENNNIQVSNIPSAKSAFNLNNLYKKGQFLTLDDSIVYDPIRVKLMCPMIKGQIISDVPPEQSPNLKPSDCNPNASDDMYSQMMGGCDPAIHGEFGKLITDSVVNIYIPRDAGTAYCSGTVIGQKWVLSAAHCFTNLDNQFDSLLKTHPAVINDKYNVKTIYIPKNYNITNSIKSDLAILELELPLPSRYKPIKLDAYVPPSGLNIPVWGAGYGGNQELRYRKQYFMTNLYDSNWPDPQNGTGNLNELYISGTKPTPDPSSGQEIAWRFTVLGDSGGPALLYDSIKQEFSVLGISSYAMGCNKTALLANTPYSYAAYTSVPAYYHFIQSVIDKTVLPDTVNSITYIPSENLDSRSSLFILSTGSNRIAHSYINDHTNEPVQKNIINTGDYPTAVAATANYAYVTNYLENTILQYRINQDGITSNRVETLPPGSNPSDIKIIDNYAFVAAYGSNQILQYSINSSTGILSYSERFDTGIKPVSIATTSVNSNHYMFIANEDSKSISVYKFIPKTGRLNIIDRDMKLSKFSGTPIKIVADGPYIFVQGTKGIYMYMFDGDEMYFKTSISIDFDLSAHSDMILLPGIKPPYGLLAISTGNTASLPVGVYDVDFAQPSIKFNSSLLIRGTGLAAYLDAANNILLYVANSGYFKQRTLSMIEIHPQKNLGDKIDFRLPRDFITVDNPTKVEIQPN